MILWRLVAREEYKVEEKVSSMDRIVDGRMLPIFLPTFPIKEEKPEHKTLMKGHGRLLKNMDNTQK